MSAREFTPTARRAITAAFGSIVFCLTFTGLSLNPRPVPWYDPLARQWEVLTHWPTPAQPAMDWYGRLMVAAAAGAAVAALTHLATGRVRRGIAPASFFPTALAINTLMAFWLCALVYGWTLGRRDLRPTPPMRFEAAPPAASAAPR